MSKMIDQITRNNIEAWNEVAPINKRINHAKELANFSNPAHSCLDEIETACLLQLQIEHKSVAQICCNNGRELISVKRMGAGRCVGFDGAYQFVEQARELAKAANEDVEFVCANIYDIGSEFHSVFDVVTITIGVLTWMPDLENFFKTLSNMLRPGGALFIYEQHPILNMIEPGAAGIDLVWECSYFDKAPYVEVDGLNYFNDEKYDAKPVTSYTHTLSDIVMAGLRSNMSLQHFEELPGHISNTWWNVEHSDLGLPMSFTAIMRKA